MFVPQGTLSILKPEKPVSEPVFCRQVGFRDQTIHTGMFVFLNKKWNLFDSARFQELSENRERLFEHVRRTHVDLRHDAHHGQIQRKRQSLKKRMFGGH